MPRLFVWFEVFVEHGRRRTPQLLSGIGSRSDRLPEVIGSIVIRGVDAEILEAEMVHPLGEDHGDGVGLLSQSAAGIPYLNAAPTASITDHVLGGMFDCLRIPEKKSERHLVSIQVY